MDDEFEHLQEKLSRMFSRLKPKIWRDDFVFALGGPISGSPEGNFKKGDIGSIFCPNKRRREQQFFMLCLELTHSFASWLLFCELGGVSRTKKEQTKVSKSLNST